MPLLLQKRSNPYQQLFQIPGDILRRTEYKCEQGIPAERVPAYEISRILAYLPHNLLPILAQAVPDDSIAENTPDILMVELYLPVPFPQILLHRRYVIHQGLELAPLYGVSHRHIHILHPLRNRIQHIHQQPLIRQHYRRIDPDFSAGMIVTQCWGVVLL